MDGSVRRGDILSSTRELTMEASASGPSPLNAIPGCPLGCSLEAKKNSHLEANTHLDRGFRRPDARGLPRNPIRRLITIWLLNLGLCKVLKRDGPCLSYQEGTERKRRGSAYDPWDDPNRPAHDRKAWRNAEPLRMGKL